ncbi:C-type natriuretic peptide-like [Leucoraja erinacea]|uniref:C-type natriuretic peptide-like n=1 Tax=Leucoraja erinaceus TaxID=7782 RepID=UPI0024549A56|nr:C-type natriuretic peptide-like [Leucoraja erinacea]
MLVSVVSLATVCLVVSGRPSGQHRDQPGPEPERGLRASEPLPDTAVAAAAASATHTDTDKATDTHTDTHTDTQAQRAWAKFIHFVHKQKSPHGRRRKGPTKGCFRMRMDRIGSMSKLGC